MMVSPRGRYLPSQPPLPFGWCTKTRSMQADRWGPPWWRYWRGRSGWGWTRPCRQLCGCSRGARWCWRQIFCRTLHRMCRVLQQEPRLLPEGDLSCNAQPSARAALIPALHRTTAPSPRGEQARPGHLFSQTCKQCFTMFKFSPSKGTHSPRYQSRQRSLSFSAPLHSYTETQN